jgi:hypothetical protein
MSDIEINDEPLIEGNLEKYFIKLDFNLPNHDNELSSAENAIHLLKLKVVDAIINDKLNDNVHQTYYDEIIRVLDYVGRLSMSVFAVNEELEKQYAVKFIHAPAMAKQLWLDHYENLHTPYNVIKNRCFKLLDRLDEGYIERFKKNPPNWNP